MEFKAWMQIAEQEDENSGPPEATGIGLNRLWWHAMNQTPYPLQAFQAIAQSNTNLLDRAAGGSGYKDSHRMTKTQVPSPESKFPNLNELIQNGQIKEIMIRVPVTQDNKKMTNQAWIQFLDEVKNSYPHMLQPLQNVIKSGGTPDNFLRKEKQVVNGQAMYKFLLPTDPNLINALFS